MAEAVGRDGELHRHVRRALGPVEQETGPGDRDLTGSGAAHPVPLGAQDVGDHAVRRGDPVADVTVDDARKEVVRDRPLVMPADPALRLLEQVVTGEPGLREDLLHHSIVEPQKRGVQLGDDEVLVVARIADDGPALAVARHVRPGERRLRRVVRVGDVLTEQERHSPLVEAQRRMRQRLGACS